MTNEEGGTFLIACGTFLSHGQEVTLADGAYLQLPDNISELNDYVCGPMNRKGRVCSECIDGFSPSVTSIGYMTAPIAQTLGMDSGLLALLLAIYPITMFRAFLLKCINSWRSLTCYTQHLCGEVLQLLWKCS